MLDIQDPCSETESTPSPLDFPLCQPKDVLERIALHPFQDFESLLLDVSKLAITTKSSNDLRSGKQASRRPSLPSFPWSHAFGGHSRTNYDTVKLSTSRSTCQGKWARMGVIASSTVIDRSHFTNLDSFSYDQSLVPSTGSSDNKLLASLCATIPSGQWDSSSPVTCKDYQVNAGTSFYLATCITVYLKFLFSLPPSFSLSFSRSHLTNLCPENAEFGGQVDTKENGMMLWSATHLLHVYTFMTISVQVFFCPRSLALSLCSPCLTFLFDR